MEKRRRSLSGLGSVDAAQSAVASILAAEREDRLSSIGMTTEEQREDTRARMSYATAPGNPVRIAGAISSAAQLLAAERQTRLSALGMTVEEQHEDTRAQLNAPVNIVDAVSSAAQSLAAKRTKKLLLGLPKPDFGGSKEATRKRYAASLCCQLRGAEMTGKFSRSLRGDIKDREFATLRRREPASSTYTTRLLPAVARFSRSATWPPLFAAGLEDGTLLFGAVTGGDIGENVRTLNAHGDSIFDIAWFRETNSSVISAASDWFLRVWDVETSAMRYQCTGHSSTVKSVSVRHNDSTVFASGGRDGNAIIWDTRCEGRKGVGAVETKRPFKKLVNIHRRENATPNGKKRPRTMQAPEAKSQVTSVAWFKDDVTVLPGGDLVGQVKIWDTRYAARTPLCALPNYPVGARRYGVTSVDVSPQGSEFLICSMDNHIYRYSCLYPFAGEIACHSVNVNSFYVRAAYNSCGKYILCGSSKKKVYVWDTEEEGESPSPVLVLRGHLGEVHTVDMPAGRLDTLLSCSEDSTIRLWTAGVMEGRRRGWATPSRHNSSHSPYSTWQSQESPSPSPQMTRRPAFAVPRSRKRSRQVSLYKYFQTIDSGAGASEISESSECTEFSMESEHSLPY